MGPTRVCSFQQVTTYACETFPSGSTPKALFIVFSNKALTVLHGWISSMTSQYHYLTGSADLSGMSIHSRHNNTSALPWDPLELACQSKKTYQLGATTNKMHCSLSSPRDLHNPPLHKLFNAQLANTITQQM